MTPCELLALLQQKQHLDWESRRQVEERTYRQAKSILQAAQKVSVPEAALSGAEERVRLYEDAQQAARQFDLPPLQSIGDFDIFMKLKTLIDEGLPYCGDFKPNTKLFIGSLELMRANAWSAKVNDEGEYLIVLHSGLLNALSTLTNILSIIHIPDEPAMIDLEQIEKALPIFVGVVKKYVFYLALEDYAKFQLEWHTEREEMWCWLDTLCKMLVLAHEYSHVLLGHFDDSKCLTSVKWATGVNELTQDKRRELEADLLAFHLIVYAHPMRGRDDVGFSLRVAAAWISVVLFFETMWVFERAKTIAGLETRSTSHPEPRERVDSILSFIRTKRPNFDFLSHLLTLEGIIRNCFNALWIKAEKDLSTCARENAAKIQEIYSRMSLL